MKDPRFIELLNLYVDQQLTAAEAVELETEIKQNQTSRRTYQQYCRMQKGCVQLFEQECQSAPSTSALSRALADVEQKITAFPDQRTQWRQRGYYAAGFAAMAACVAFVLVRQAPVPAALPVAVVSKPAAEVVAVAVVEPAVAVPAVQVVAIPPADPQTTEQRRLYTVFPVRKFMPVQVVSYNGDAGAQIGEQPDFNWMKTVELAPMRPVSVEELTTDSATNLQEPANIFINNRRPVQGLYEKAAFQFQK